MSCDIVNRKRHETATTNCLTTTIWPCIHRFVATQFIKAYEQVQYTRYLRTCSTKFCRSMNYVVQYHRCFESTIKDCAIILIYKCNTIYVNISILYSCSINIVCEFNRV